MQRSFHGGLLSVFILAKAGSAPGAVILALDTTRTGNSGNTGSTDRTLGQTSMVDATNILLNRGFTIGMRSNFLAANTVGANVLFTGLVDTAFSAQEIIDIRAFVN